MNTLIARVNPYLAVLGVGWLVPMLRLASGDSPSTNLRELWQQLGIPLVAIALFMAAWAGIAARIETSLGALPGPAAVWTEAQNLVAEHAAERTRRDEFYTRQEARNAAALAENPEADVRVRRYTGKPTYFDQILTSLATVFTGFVLGTLVAVPLGVLAGLSKTVNAAINPLVQVFKPVSPLAWLPIVTMVVSALYVSTDPLFQKSFITSAITVTLCSLWPTLINTALGVASIDKDLMNVGRVLQLGWFTQVFRIVLPSAMPLIDR